MNTQHKRPAISEAELPKVVQLVSYSIIAALIGVIFMAIVLLIGLVLQT
ncbi:MAG: hypothetical protein ACK41O_05085 [Runella zeae]